MDRDAFSRLFDLTDRVALVTGGTRGIGRAVAEGLGLAGARVVVASRRPEACAATEAALREQGIEAVGVAADMGALDTPDRLVGAATDTFGRLDIVVNNAANALAQPLGAQTPEAWQKSFEVNLRGPVLLTQAAVPVLADSDAAAVVNVSSIGAFLFSGGVAIYAAMKAALVATTRSFAAELAPRGIRVNCLAPGTVDTDMVRKVGPGAAERMAAGSLLKRPASPDEMVGPVLFLASPASSYMTGQVLVVDGGLYPH
ncbi:MAG: SDR family oxidoreductase [Actinomyces sp.]|nr:MAG: SDR family oxidoreductase [Actinomyces sp.]